jgi:NAD(P)-dependent dehydrogenase (short-subunit alcohol dehydrogenase family)
MRFDGCAAIVTGAAQGIGLAIAERLAADGAKVVMSDVNAGKLRDAAARLAAAGHTTIDVAADATSPKQVDALIAATISAFGQIDILVNNAGGSGSVTAQNIEDVTEEIWDHVIDRNMKSTFLVSRAVVPHMKARRYGRIVNVSSGIAKGSGRVTGTAGAVLPYATSKAGILGFTSTLAKLLAPDGITVNAVVPGFILTEPGARVRDWFDSLPEEARAQLGSRTPMGRIGSAGELANAVAFLASREASFVSGAALDVAGAA